MLPEVCSVPSVSDNVVVLECAYAAEDIVLGETSPTAVLTLQLCPLLPLRLLFCHSPDIVEERHVHLAEVCRLSRPVVHLNVDVRVDIRVPCYTVDIVPDALEIRRRVDTA